MIKVGRIYDFATLPPECTAVFVDRLYPRGIPKSRMANIVQLKNLTPSTPLRRWYHEDPEIRFNDFAARYRNELAQDLAQADIRTLRTLAETQTVLLLTAVRHPQHSHVSVLLDYLGIPFQAA